ncbi:MAG TPA: cytochrome c [Bacteroidetes bacterium]|nr:cytochrome c [Bacteroidota bacterium]
MKALKISGSILGLIFGISLLTAAGCATKGVQPEKLGAQLWGENCVRCHNAPNPQAFSDAQWETATMHMRVRASLTADETEKIVAFLKMAN